MQDKRILVTTASAVTRSRVRCNCWLGDGVIGFLRSFEFCTCLRELDGLNSDVGHRTAIEIYSAVFAPVEVALLQNVPVDSFSIRVENKLQVSRRILPFARPERNAVNLTAPLKYPNINSVCHEESIHRRFRKILIRIAFARFTILSQSFF